MEVKKKKMAKVKPRVKVPKTAKTGEIIEIKTLISHPMHSGRGIDGEGNIIPRNIINKFLVKFNNVEVMNVELKPSVSSNPFFTFPFKVESSGEFEFIWFEDGGEVFTAKKNIVTS